MFTVATASALGAAQQARVTLVVGLVAKHLAGTRVAYRLDRLEHLPVTAGQAVGGGDATHIGILAAPQVDARLRQRDDTGRRLQRAPIHHQRPGQEGLDVPGGMLGMAAASAPSLRTRGDS